MFMMRSRSRMEGKGKEAGTKKIYPLAAADYQLLEEIGHGLNSTVYRAICIPFNEVVAIKSLDVDKCSDVENIQREAQTMQQIAHPHVVAAYCSIIVDRSVWILTPFLAGGSCLHVMKVAYPDGFEEPVIASVLVETLQALAYLHKDGYIHRDVKAANILMDERGGVKLGDFGVSASTLDTSNRQLSRKTFVGTPCWMAPEVVEQLHGYGSKADIWSFGITALELAHGHPPFSKYSPMKILLMILDSPPPCLNYERDKRFSKSFKDMVKICLVKDPAKRPTADNLLQHPFFKKARLNHYRRGAKHLLHGFPPLVQRVQDLKLGHAERLCGHEIMHCSEQEQNGQNEPKDDVVCWDFDVEDLQGGAKPEMLNEPDDRLSSTTSRKDDDSSHKLKGGDDTFWKVVPADNAPAHPANIDHHDSGDRNHALQTESTHRDNLKDVTVAPSLRPQLKQHWDMMLGNDVGFPNQPGEDGNAQAKVGDTRSEIAGEEQHLKEAHEDHHDREDHRRLDDSGSLGGKRDIPDEKESGDCARDHSLDSVILSSRHTLYRNRARAASSAALVKRDLSEDFHPFNEVLPWLTRSSSNEDVSHKNLAKGPLVQTKGRFTVSPVSFPNRISPTSSPVVTQYISPLHSDADGLPANLTKRGRSSYGRSVCHDSVGRSRSSSCTSLRGTAIDYGRERDRDQYIRELEQSVVNFLAEVQLEKSKNTLLEQQLKLSAISNLERGGQKWEVPSGG